MVVIYRAALPQVFGYLLSRCRSVAVAEDLTAETFMAAVIAVRQRQVDEVTVAWLVGVARHKLVDHWRRVGREQRGLAAVEGELRELDDPWDELLDLHAAHAALWRLPVPQRSALTLRYLDGLPVAAVAEQLGRSVHATETLLVRARAALRRVYKEKEERRRRSQVSDPLERLLTPIVPIEPRPEFAEALLRRLQSTRQPVARDTATVRYFVDDLEAAVTFYRDLLGFDVELRPSPVFAMLYRGDLRLLLSVPGEPHLLPDGTLPTPGGHNRISLRVDDLTPKIAALRRAGVRFLRETAVGVTVDTVLLADPAGNPVELFQPRSGYHERPGRGTQPPDSQRSSQTTKEPPQ